MNFSKDEVILLTGLVSLNRQQNINFLNSYTGDGVSIVQDAVKEIEKCYRILEELGK